LHYLDNACAARGKRPLHQHLHRARRQVAEVTIFFISTIPKLFPVEKTSTKSMSEISLFGGQCPHAGLK
jgi:hypothetical protein